MTTTPQPSRKALRTAVLLVAAAALLLGVFALYTRPLFLVKLADQMWACF